MNQGTLLFNFWNLSNKNHWSRREIIEETNIDASGKAVTVKKVISKDKNGNTVVGKEITLIHQNYCVEECVYFLLHRGDLCRSNHRGKNDSD